MLQKKLIETIDKKVEQEIRGIDNFMIESKPKSDFITFHFDKLKQK